MLSVVGSPGASQADWFVVCRQPPTAYTQLSSCQGVDVAFPPNSVDYESRPYHMGWVLHAWPSNREKKSDMQTSALYENRPLKG